MLLRLNSASPLLARFGKNLDLTLKGASRYIQVPIHCQCRYQSSAIALLTDRKLFNHETPKSRKTLLSHLSVPQQVYKIPSLSLSGSSRANSNYGELLYIGQEFDKIKKSLGIFYALSASIAVISPKVLSMAMLSSSTLAVVFMSVHIFVFVFLNPWGLYQFGKRYVHELYHDASTDTYTATLLSPTITGVKTLQFTPRDCQMPANPTLFTSFFVNGKSLFINSDSMNYHDYMTMLRYASDYDYENPDRQEQFEKKSKKDDKDSTTT